VKRQAGRNGSTGVTSRFLSVSETFIYPNATKFYHIVRVRKCWTWLQEEHIQEKEGLLL
jgi:hypothetical protein